MRSDNPLLTCFMPGSTVPLLGNDLYSYIIKHIFPLEKCITIRQLILQWYNAGTQDSDVGGEIMEWLTAIGTLLGGIGLLILGFGVFIKSATEIKEKEDAKKAAK